MSALAESMPHWFLRETDPLPLFRWTLDRYHRAIELGQLEGCPVELIHGQVTIKSDRAQDFSELSSQLLKPTAPGGLYLWSIKRYLGLAESGALDGAKVELLGGKLVEMTPQGPGHFGGVTAVHYACLDVFGRDRYTVHVQMPLMVTVAEAVPEPDVFVTAGPPSAKAGLPSTAELVIEVAESSVLKDRRWKSHIYASAQVKDYWLLNLTKRQLEVFRQPVADPASPFAHRYENQFIVTANQSLAPLERPDQVIKVEDLLP